MTLLVLAAAFSIALLLAELVVRLLAPQQLVEVRPDIWMPIDSVGWTNRSDVRTTINTGERTVQVFTDSDGLRIDSVAPSPPSRRVLLIGDSFTQALQVEYRDSFGAILERTLSSNLGEPVRVHNAGVDGWDPPQYLWQARRALAARHYDALLVVLYLGNDLVGDIDHYRPAREPVEERRFAWPGGLGRAAVVKSVLYPLNDRLERRSHLFVLLKRSSELILMRTGLTASAVPSEIMESVAGSLQWELTARIAEQIASAAAGHGTPTIFALVSSSYQVEVAEFETFARGFGLDTATVSLDQPNELLGAALEKQGLTVIDPLPDFRARSVAGAQLYGRTDRHFSPAGHLAFAAAVDTAMTRLLRERTTRPRPARVP